MAKNNKRLDVETGNVVDRRIINIATYCVLRVACEVIFTNMAATKNFKVISEKMNVFRI